MFEIFDYPRLIQKITVTEESVNVLTGVITPATDANPTPITGHVSDLTQQELSSLDAALVEKGLRKFATSLAVAVGDIIRITEADSSTTDWVIEQLMYEAVLVQKYAGVPRKTFLLKRL